MLHIQEPSRYARQNMRVNIPSTRKRNQSWPADIRDTGARQGTTLLIVRIINLCEVCVKLAWLCGGLWVRPADGVREGW